MRFPYVAAALAGTVALSGCAATGVTTVGQKDALYRTNHNDYALNGRDVFVIVEGGYGADKPAFRQAVVQTMDRYRSGMNTNFTTSPRNNVNNDYKVVMLFNGPQSVQAHQLCANPEQFSTVQPIVGADTHVLAAFCQYDAPLTSVNGRATGVTSVADARFASLIQQTMTDLFPSSDERPQRDSDGGDSVP